jgi:hypothetical protein
MTPTNKCLYKGGTLALLITCNMHQVCQKKLSNYIWLGKIESDVVSDKYDESDSENETGEENENSYNKSG